jgi:hypothetical protein
MNDSLSPFCVYTIRHSRDLSKIMIAGGSGQHTEKKRWTSAQGLLDAARKSGRRLPVIFAAGENIDGLIYWAQLPTFTLTTEGHLTLLLR